MSNNNIFIRPSTNLSYYQVNYQSKRAINGACGTLHGLDKNCALKQVYGLSNRPGCRVVCSGNNGVNCTQWTATCTYGTACNGGAIIPSKCNGNICYGKCTIASSGGATTHITVKGTFIP